MFEDPDDPAQMCDLEGGARPALLSLGDVASPSQAQSSSSKNEHDFVGESQNLLQETTSPSSGKILSLERKVIFDIVMVNILDIRLLYFVYPSPDESFR